MANKNNPKIKIETETPAADQIDAIRLAIEAMVNLKAIAGITAPGDDTGIPKEMPKKLQEATSQALLQHKLRRMEESAKLEMLRLEKMRLQKLAEENAEKKAGYEKARDLINSGIAIKQAAEAVGTSAQSAAKAMDALRVAANFPRSHTGKTGGARRLTLAATGTLQIIEKGDNDEQQNNEAKSKTIKSAQKFNVRDWLEQD